MSPVTLKTQELNSIFNDLIKGIKKTIDANKHPNSVDIRLDFTSIKVDKKGFLVWSKSQESTVQLSLATQIPPHIEKA